MKRNNDAFVEKLSSVHDFKSFYTKENCLIQAAILESDDTSNKKYALVRIFVDQTNKKQPYVIFVNNKETIVFIDLISESSEEIIGKHLNFSPEQSVFEVGMLETGETINLSKDGDLVATLLWAADIKTNLDPKKGLEAVKKLLGPTTF
jgi:hypothetical protein